MNRMDVLPPSAAVIEDSWQSLSALTAARIALGRCGSSLPTAETLSFALAHAQARDAVHSTLDWAGLAQQLHGHGLSSLKVHSAAADRATYLQRPDLGRQLLPACRQQLQSSDGLGADVLFVVGDGLSSLAVERQVVPLLVAVQPYLQRDGLSIGPVVLAEQARVALGDEIGECLHARLVVVLIGERPGLSSPDSLGVYLTFAPRVGLLDSARNCISNVRPQGLGHAQAAYKLHWLIARALAGGQTGVALKDGSAEEAGYQALAMSTPPGLPAK